MTIFVTAPGEFSGDNLLTGRYYYVEDLCAGTLQQNKTWHALLQEYYRSGAHSYNARSFPHFRELIKLYLGAGTEKYNDLFDDEGRLLPTPSLRYRLISWSKYTKKERMESIDRLIAEMETAGVDSPKYREILRGINERSFTAVGCGNKSLAEQALEG